MEKAIGCPREGTIVNVSFGWCNQTALICGPRALAVVCRRCPSPKVEK